MARDDRRLAKGKRRQMPAFRLDARSPPVPAQTVPGPMPPPEKNRHLIAFAVTAATTTATATASRAVTGRVLLRSRGSWSAFASGPRVCRSAADATREGDPQRLGPGNFLPQSHRSPSKQRPESPPRASTIACDDNDTAIIPLAVSDSKSRRPQ